MISRSNLDDKRGRILLAAKRLFVNQGFHDTPTSVIAAEAGISNGTLFHYFKTKDLLIYNLYKETSSSFFLVTTAGVAEEKGLRRQLGLLWENTINWAMNRPLDFLFLQQFSHSPYQHQLIKDEVTEHYAFYRDLIEEGKNTGQLRDLPTDLMYELCTHQLYGMINYLRSHPDQQRKPSLMKAAFKCHIQSLLQ